MKFRFEFEVKKMAQPIAHTHQLLLMGSCFTENMGEKLRKHKFTLLENPNGILFNPVSVVDALNSYVANTQITEQQLFCYNEAWHSWRHHSRFSGITPNAAVAKINAATQQAHFFIQKTNYLFITLGSAWVYMLSALADNPTQTVVAANNHKAPANWFEKRLLSAAEVVAMFSDCFEQLFQFNPHLNIIFTISPVRHLREGVVENNRSKAVLIQAVHDLVAKYTEKLYYFPAYELVIDDLRDYRFYAEDLVHPNYHATQYVWEKLVGACISEASQQLMEQIAAINLAFQHKPFNPTSQQHQQFLAASLQKTRMVQAQHPYVDFSKELAFFANTGK